MIDSKEYAKLKAASEFKTDEDIKYFEQKVYLIAQNKDINEIMQLMSLFNDHTEYPNIMYGLVHVIETYPDEIYINSIFYNLSKSLNDYKHWIQVLVYRILNDLKSFEYFKKNMGLANRQDLLKLFELIEHESEHHRDIIKELRLELEKLK